MSKGFPPKTVKKEIMSLLLFLTSQGLEQQLELLEVAGLQQFSGSFRSTVVPKVGATEMATFHQQQLPQLEER